MKYFFYFVFFVLINSLASAEVSFYDNPNDVIIYSNFPITSSVVLQQGSEGGVGGIGTIKCLTEWNCSSWSVCIDDVQKRNCTKINYACYAGIKPNEVQTCTSVREKEPEEFQDKENCLQIFLFVGITIVIAFLIVVLLNKLKLYKPSK